MKDAWILAHVCMIFLILPGYAQAQTQRSSDIPSRLAAEQSYCFQHPEPSAKCYGPGLPRSTSSPQSNSPTPAAASSYPTPNSQRVLDNYKAESKKSAADFNGAITSKSVQQPLPSLPADTSAVQSPEVANPPSYNSQTQESNYQAGYVLGQALGSSVGDLIEKHHIRSFCKKHGDATNWRFEDGSTMACKSVNAGKLVRVWPSRNPIPETAIEITKQENARKAHELMESLRNDLAEEVSYPDSPLRDSVMAGAKSSWSDMRDMYCSSSPGAAYTDLQNKQQTCAN